MVMKLIFREVFIRVWSSFHPLIFITILEDIMEEFKTSCPQELLYGDDLVFITENVQEFEFKFHVKRQNWESKTKVLIRK